MKIVEGITALFIASVGLWMVITAVSHGVLKGEDSFTVVRAERPTRFWLEVAIGVIISVGCIGFAVWKLRGS